MITRQYPASKYIPLFDNKNLGDHLNQSYPLIILSKKIPSDRLEDFCAQSYSDFMGCASKPLRLMVGLSFLKYVFNLSGERVVTS
jgi:hypothetical protein